MDGTLLASDLGFPEGPVVMPDGSIVICDGNTGELLRWADGAMSRFSDTGGSPWGAILGSDGAIYLTQGGNVPGAPDQSAVPGIQRVRADGTVEQLASNLAGHPLAGPNDLAFGPDGRLWFTDSGTEGDDRYAEQQPGRLYVLDCLGRRRAGDRAAGRVSERHRLRRPGPPLLDGVDGPPRLPPRERRGHDVRAAERRPRARRHGLRSRRPAVRLHDDLGRPDSALPRRRQVLEEIMIGECATNCIFDGPTLWVTATKVAELGYQQTTGTFWSIATDATGGLPLIPGKL